MANKWVLLAGEDILQNGRQLLEGFLKELPEIRTRGRGHYCSPERGAERASSGRIGRGILKETLE